MKVMMDKTNMDMDMGVVDRNHVVVKVLVIVEINMDMGMEIVGRSHVVVKVLVTVETDHVIELNVA
jgi:hypothetical protein